MTAQFTRKLSPILLMAATLAGTAATCSAQLQADLADMSLEELLRLEVTSVSRRQQQLSRAPAAIYVITQEDIRRSGLRSLPELLRLAPGVHVARINAYTWAISARGFNGRIASKMLVLIDGRTVYTPLFSGVYWEMHDLPLGDIERIEVIRGPGATMWGSNAVNGVVNIITKSARDTPGGFIEAVGGTVERAFGSFGYGGKLNESFFYRLYSKFTKSDGMSTPEGASAGDDWCSSHTGLRVDWQLGERDELTLLADVGVADFHRLAEYPTLNPLERSSEWQQYNNNSSDFLARWTHRHRSGSISVLQGYVDHYDRRDPLLGEKRRTFDIEYQNQMTIASGHLWSWGFGTRASKDNALKTVYSSLRPARRQLNWFHAFFQDEILLAESHAAVTLGAKTEYTELGGFELQPSAQFLWEVAPVHTFWASISRAARTPNRGEQDAVIWMETAAGTPESFYLPAVMQYVGDPSYGSQHLFAIEAGWRHQPHRRLGLDLAVFRNRYDRIRFMELESTQVRLAPTPHVIAALSPVHGPGATTWGAELLVRYEAAEFWRLSGSYSWLSAPRIAEQFAFFRAESTEAPDHLANLRSQTSMPGRFELDLAAYYAGSMVDQARWTLVQQGVPASIRLDLRLARPLTETLEWSVTAHDLLRGHRAEFQPEGFSHSSEIRRGVYVRVQWRY